MLIVTTWASLQESVFVGGDKLFSQPWGIATLADAYFAFLTFYFWVYYKERSLLSRLIWFVAIMLLGNIAMSLYALLQIRKSKTDTMEGFLLRPAGSKP